MNVLTGPIKPLHRTLPIDRSDISHMLWERHPKPNALELPWPSASAFTGGDVRDLLASASTLVVASSAPALYQHVLAALRPGMRAYAYGAAGMEIDRALLPALSRAPERMAVRLGHALPADWIVVDGGRTGVLLVGPPDAVRRWAIPLEAMQARSLFEAFRVLFWFNSRREGLPDATGTFSFGPPLASPYRDPGKDVSLPAGRLVIDRPLPDPVPDAEFRIVPDGSTPGRAATLLTPPNTRTFDAAARIAAARTRLVWTETGLPRTSITRHRLVMDLVAGPIGLQIEWETGTAIDVFHRVNKACEAPEWTFHDQRRLRDVAGLVLLAGASAPAPVTPDERINLPDLRAPLATLETATPTELHPPSPLARSLVYAWRTVPEAVPAGAGKALIIRQWTALDEWASRSVAILRARLASMEGEEGSFLARLKGFIRGHNAVQQERMRIKDALAELGEQPPSQRSDARDVVDRLAAEAGKLHGLLKQAHAAHQKAEDDAEERAQREAWQGRVRQATADLAVSRTALVELEARATAADAELRDAEAAVLQRTAELRAARLTRLTEASDQEGTALAETQAQLKALDTRHRGKAPKDERKPLTAQIARLEPLLAASRRDIAAIDTWRPATSELTAVNSRLKAAREGHAALRKPRATLMSELERIERATKEDFAYRPAARLPTTSLPEVAPAPTIPAEAPPELGELFEHQDQRFLAVRTWEQWPRASRVAERLRAELVAFPDASK